ncbi:MAG TPA: MmcQ/YjbR family DNA-binding protein [Rhizomicrobium sp.]|nr:MmcQ/YjbR family DNA-binding protein [Rhizomicrobium sp.]
MKGKRGITAADVKKIALSFPLAEARLSYGKPAFLVGKKFFTRVRAEDGSIVLIVDSIDQRDMMLEMDPRTYFITEHYRNYPSILVRMDRISGDELRAMLERRWRALAPKKLLKAMEAGAKAAPPGKTKKGGKR